MLHSGKIRTLPAAVKAAAPRDRAAERYDRHSAALYRQALLTLGDAGLAERVVRDVILDECGRPPADGCDGDEAGRRMALSVYTRCRELTSAPAWRNEIPDGREFGSQAARIESFGLLSNEERGMLALLVFGGLEYAQASRELGTSPRETAILVRDALRRLTIAPTRSS